MNGELLTQLDDLRRRIARLEAQETVPSSTLANYVLTDGSRTGATANPQHFTGNIVTPYVDVPLQSSTEGQEFNDNTSSYPAGWTEVTAPAARNTSRRYGFWFLQGGGVGYTAYKYQKQAVGTVAGGSSYQSFEWGPIFRRMFAYTADVTYFFGLHANNSGAPSTTNYLRAALSYDSAGAKWKFRSERKVGGTETLGTWLDLTAVPQPQPLYVRLVVRGSDPDTRTYLGVHPWAEVHRQYDSVDMSVTWGAPWWVLEMSRAGTTGSDYLFLGAIDKSGNA